MRGKNLRAQNRPMSNAIEMQTDEPPLEIDLVSLAQQGVPRMTLSWCAALAECAALCLHLNGHSNATTFDLTGDFEQTLVIRFTSVDESVVRTYKDLDIAAELGAYGVAFSLVESLTPFTVIERSRKTTGFDFWLGLKEDALMQRKARLEVSGLYNPPNKEFNRRIKMKINQTKISDVSGLPAFVAVVSFRQPKAHFGERKDTKE